MPSLVLVQPRKTRPFITERLLMGRKESNQTNKQKLTNVSLKMRLRYQRHWLYSVGVLKGKSSEKDASNERDDSSEFESSLGNSGVANSPLEFKRGAGCMGDAKGDPIG